MTATTTATLTSRVPNDYADVHHFTHVNAPTPAGGEDLTEWMVAELCRYTGGARVHTPHLDAVHEARIIDVPHEFDHLLGLSVSAMG